MSILDKILLYIGTALVIACLVLEFTPVAPVAKTILLSVTAVYSLATLVYFKLKKK